LRTVALGIGNTILSDEGVGVHAADASRAAYEIPDDVEVIDGGTTGFANCPFNQGRCHPPQPLGREFRLQLLPPVRHQCTTP
jgi:hypothetical protein